MPKQQTRRPQQRRPRRRVARGSSTFMLRRILVLVILVLLVAILAILAFGCPFSPAEGEAEGTPKPGIFGGRNTPEPTPTLEPTPTPEPTPFFHTPTADDTAQMSNFGFKRELEINGQKADSYAAAVPIDFGNWAGDEQKYAALEGVITFRGNNYRNAPTFGTIAPTQKKLSLEWTVSTGSMPKGDSSSGVWSGSGWVGQPLLVRWPESTKRIMNMYDSAKNKADLVEVILATMDGYVYFLDLETGEKTRDRLHVDMPFKGAGALDPRGYPLLYLGSGEGYTGDEKRDTRAMVYSLIDFERLYEFGKRDPFALRAWHAYDSSPLVHAATDTLLYPGENGIFYRIKLNTQYDEAAGTISVNPTETVKFRYDADRYANSIYYRGYEDSVAVWGEYAYLTDNGGMMQCINLNTMDIVWVQDTWDDTNGTPVLEVDEEGHTAYLYVGTSLRINAKKDVGEVAFFKIDAVTGRIVWQDVRNVATQSGVSGGIQATAVLGKHSIDDLVIIPYARYPAESPGRGALVALDKATGEERWSVPMRYVWSSPLDLYDAEGNAYIVAADSNSKVCLIEGKTGTLLDTYDFGEENKNNFEASPAAFGNMVVLGSRASKIYGFKIN